MSKKMTVRLGWGDKRGREFEVLCSPDNTRIVSAIAGALSQGSGCYVFFYDGPDVVEIYSIPPGNCMLEMWQSSHTAKEPKAACYKIVFGDSKINGVVRVEAQLIKA